MTSRLCCQPDERRPSVLRRFRGAAKWGVPGALLVLMPKCPACVAGYVALFTGVGLSITVAAHLRMLVLLMCLVTLGVLATRRICSLAAQRRTS